MIINVSVVLVLFWQIYKSSSGFGLRKCKSGTDNMSPAGSGHVSKDVRGTDAGSTLIIFQLFIAKESKQVVCRNHGAGTTLRLLPATWSNGDDKRCFYLVLIMPKEDKIVRLSWSGWLVRYQIVYQKWVHEWVAKSFNVPLDTLQVISGTVFAVNLLAATSSFYKSDDLTRLSVQ